MTTIVRLLVAATALTMLASPTLAKPKSKVQAQYDQTMNAIAQNIRG